MRRSNTLLLWLALTHVSTSVGAQTPSTPPSGAGAESTTSATSDAKTSRARSHFQRGVSFYEERNYDGALAEFSRAHELVPNYRVLYNLAQTQAERHDYVDAIRLFAEYLEQGGAEIPAARREATEREREGLLERVASVQIESNIGGAKLWVDGRPRGVVPSSYTLQLNAGMATVRLEKPGYEPVSRQLTIVGGDSVVVQMHLDPIATTETGARPPAEGNVDRRGADGGANTALWLSAGATTLLAGATATFAVLATRENAALDRELRQYQEDPTQLDDTRSRVRTYAALTDAFGVATVVGLGATLFFAVAGVDEDAPAAARADRVRLLVGSSGLSVRKDF
jgi:tetratricopeptide (TPR) repeat protein